jgi:hypothetical protein
MDRLGTGTSLEYAAVMGTSVAHVEQLLTEAGADLRVVGQGKAWSPQPRDQKLT